jgi:hypothetical protein
MYDYSADYVPTWSWVALNSCEVVKVLGSEIPPEAIKWCEKICQERVGGYLTRPSVPLVTFLGVLHESGNVLIWPHFYDLVDSPVIFNNCLFSNSMLAAAFTLAYLVKHQSSGDSVHPFCDQYRERLTGWIKTFYVYDSEHIFALSEHLLDEQ